MHADLPISSCDRSRINDFLNSPDFGLNDEELLRHLDDCMICRSYIEREAADLDTWQKLRQHLPPKEFDVAENPNYSTSTIVCDVRAVDASDVLDALAPTDNPHHLGRLGGYEITGVVGAGGMGVVLKAIDHSLDRVVAIKVMSPRLANSSAARKRFLREAKAVAAVLHPNVIPIHGVAGNSDLPHLVMSYVRGGSLQKRIEQEGPLPTVEVLRIGSQIAAGLAAAHDQGLVHRDVKPENILLECGVERVTLTDFGLARAVDDVALTREGGIVGTPQYMSPEQARGESVDQKSDLFSLGSVLYTLCTGRAPFRGENAYVVMRRISDDQPIPIRELNPDIPEWLCCVIKKLMAKRTDERFATAAQVHELFEACTGHVQQPTTVELPQEVKRLAAARASERDVSRSGHGRLAAFPLLALSMFALIFAGVMYYLQTDKGTVRIEVLDESLAVTIEHQTVTEEDSDKPPLTLRPGAYDLIVKLGEKEMLTENIQLRRGDKLAFKAELRNGRVVLSKEENVVQSKPVPNKKQELVGPKRVPASPAPDIGSMSEVDNTIEALANPKAWKDDVTPTFDTDRFIPTPFLLNGRVHALEYSPDGNQILASGSFWGAALFNAKSGELVRQMPYGGMHVTGDFSPDGKRIVLVNRLAGESPVWNVEPGEFETSYPMCRWVARYSFDGNVLFTISAENLMTAFSTETGKRLDLVIDDDRTFAPAMIAASPKHSLVAAVSAKGNLRVWDYQAGKLLAESNGAALGVHNCKEIEFTPDGKSIVVLGGDSATELRDARTLKPKQRFETGFKKLKSMSLAISGDGKRLAVGCESGYIVVFGLLYGRRIHVCRVRNDYVAALAFSPDGRYLACGFETEGGIFVLDIGDFSRTKEYCMGIPLDVRFKRPPPEAFMPGPREALENGARFQDRVSNIPFKHRSWVDPSDVIDPTELVRKKAVE